MAIISEAWDNDRGNNLFRPEDKKISGEKRGNAIIQPLTITDSPSPANKSAHTKKAAASAALAEEIISTHTVPGPGADPTPSLSNDGFPGPPSFSDDWLDKPDGDIQDPLAKIGAPRGPGRPMRTIWNSSGYPPMDMVKPLLDQYGPNWLLWDPETLREEIREDFSTTLDDLVFEKVMAIKLLFSSSVPWKEWDVFQNVALAFNDIPVDFLSMQYLSPAQAAYAIKQINAIRKEEFSDDVQAYIATICHQEGLVWLSGELEIAQEYLDKLNVTDDDFKQEVQDIWTTIRSKDLRTWEFKEDKLGIQLSRLAAIQLYIEEKLRTLAPETGK